MASEHGEELLASSNRHTLGIVGGVYSALT
jgi:hypothetical protein